MSVVVPLRDDVASALNQSDIANRRLSRNVAGFRIEMMDMEQEHHKVTKALERQLEEQAEAFGSERRTTDKAHSDELSNQKRGAERARIEDSQRWRWWVAIAFASGSTATLILNGMIGA